MIEKKRRIRVRKKLSNRDTKKIRIWMIENDLTVTEIAKDLEISSPVVSFTIGGYDNNKKVLRFLLGRGCPREILDLPERFRGGEKVERRRKKREEAKA